ncbi:glycosyltransferase family 4 protein [Flavivirga abyssicola]|uniref:glycosyltransferase family 4 protein n=1 Tax=Flavivirga abyssicola TaxID=3063533 RepID=UPI0026E015F3|nr:glycosyltransferase family 4 protein [Flavivirga sp. MEBiC07777]WVK14794.1 glycosyltransferase family 4 protein [Flavivirga sp. MEBiC07777]
MKILFVTHYSFLYGANKSLLQLLIDLRAYYGVEALVIVPQKGTFSDQLEENKIDYLIFRYYNWLNANTFIKSKTKLILNKFLFKRIFSSLKQISFSCDLIHTNSSVTNLGGYLSKKMKTPHVWHIREYGQDDFNIKYYTGIKSAGNYFSSNASIVIAISKDLKKYYSQYINPEKIRVVYNGIKLKENFVKEYNNDKALRICVLGVISENKNQIEVIKALSYLKNTKKNSNFVLYIVGDGTGKYMQFLKEFVKKEKLDKNIFFKGYISDVDVFLKTIDLGVVSSQREAFGRVTVEFMMNKIPVIASNTGANKEIIVSKDLGYLYTLGNFKQLAEIIHNIDQNREDLKLIGNSAYDHAVNNFSSKLNTDNIFQVYKELKKQ